ncbi:hypothetical protein [Oceanibaculum pacificum]|uniref:Uncharacterized protein n=1 Tax=Oceanibaculum pacificum TaxID=580166 RepID=A0A154W3L8_9PROT|nr:hypothetical protein [Oceanibaculum pacificum]KZD08138.1 hypothetical protein AUP43_09010 [Oceanibaculum pacificum]
MIVDSIRLAFDRTAGVSPVASEKADLSAVSRAPLPDRDLTPRPTEAAGPRVWGNGYLSPVIRFDSNTSTLFFEIRAFETGDTERQFPRERAVELYQLFQDVRDNGPSGSAPPQADDAPPTPTAPRALSRDGEEAASRSAGPAGSGAPSVTTPPSLGDARTPGRLLSLET